MERILGFYPAARRGPTSWFIRGSSATCAYEVFSAAKRVFSPDVRQRTAHKTNDENLHSACSLLFKRPCPLPAFQGKKSHFGLITLWLTLIHFFCFCFTLHFCHLFSCPPSLSHSFLYVSVCVCVDGWVDVFVGRIEEAKFFKNHSNMPLNERTDSQRKKKMLDVVFNGLWISVCPLFFSLFFCCFSIYLFTFNQHFSLPDSLPLLSPSKQKLLCSWFGY